MMKRLIKKRRKGIERKRKERERKEGECVDKESRAWSLKLFARRYEGCKR